MSMRIAVGGFFYETNTLAPGTTDLEDFVRPGMVAGAALIEALAGPGFSMGTAMRTIAAAGHISVPLVWASALPGPTVTARCFEHISARLLEQIAHAGAIDAVYLELHGAM